MGANKIEKKLRFTYCYYNFDFHDIINAVAKLFL